jgi:acetyl-CoA synthetase
MSEDLLFHVKPDLAASAHVDAKRLRLMTNHAITDPDSFWAHEARRVEWMRFPQTIKNTSFEGDVAIKWFEDGTLNASAACPDRHLATRGDQVAIIREANGPAR